MIEIFKGIWTIDDVKDKYKFFIFNDNDIRIGKIGLSIIRNLDNSIGIRVKKGPAGNTIAMYNDDNYETNIKSITEDILSIKKKFVEGKTIVFSDTCYGSELKNSAPKTYEFLNQQLKYHFGFDNESGRKWNIIPSYSDIVSSTTLSLDEYKIDSVSNLIKSGKKVSITNDVKYNPGEFIIFKINNEKLLCQVCISYQVNIIDNDLWSLFECLSLENEKIDYIKKTDYLQTHFRFISTIKEDGSLDLNIEDYKEEEKLDKEMNVENIDKQDISSLLIEIDKLNKKIIDLKTPWFIKFFNFLKSILSKKDINKLLIANKLTGDLTQINNIIGKNTYYKLVNNDLTYYIEFKKGFIKNSINILITFKNEQ